MLRVCKIFNHWDKRVNMKWTSFFANPATFCESTAQTKRDFSILNSLLEYKTLIFDAGNTEPVATIGKIPKNRHYHNNRNSDRKIDVKFLIYTTKSYNTKAKSWNPFSWNWNATAGEILSFWTQNHHYLSNCNSDHQSNNNLCPKKPREP